MFGLSELKQTKVYQEGRQEGLYRERSLILRLLERRVGKLLPKLKSQVLSLSVTEPDFLGDALLDFAAASNLNDWLQSRGREFCK